MFSVTDAEAITARCESGGCRVPAMETVNMVKRPISAVGTAIVPGASIRPVNEHLLPRSQPHHERVRRGDHVAALPPHPKQLLAAVVRRLDAVLLEERAIADQLHLSLGELDAVLRHP